MRAVGATRLPDFVVRHADQGEAAVNQVARELKQSMSAHFPGADSSQMDAVEAWVEAEVAAPLRAWLQAVTPASRRHASEPAGCRRYKSPPALC